VSKSAMSEVRKLRPNLGKVAKCSPTLAINLAPVSSAEVAPWLVMGLASQSGSLRDT